MNSEDVAVRKSTILKNFLALSFPECLSEERIDFDMLQNLLGDWVVDENERVRFDVVRQGELHAGYS